MLRSKKFQINNFLKIFAIVFFITNTLLLSQEKNYSLKIQSNPINSDYWWLEKNNFGIKSQNIHFQVKWKLNTKKFNYIVNVIGQNDSEKIYFGESFIKYNISNTTFLKIGKYYRDFSKYLNDNLSSGHMLVSHNARPMNKIGLVTSQKIKQFKKLTFDIGIAHGMFDTNQFYTKAPLLHEKFIYMNLKKNNYQITFGIVHEAMWSGASVRLGKQPNSLEDFIKIFFAEDGEKMEGDSHANALGSHLGIWDFAFHKKNGNQIFKLYYQHFFEDTSSLRLRNEIDGLWGIELKNYIPKTTILFEYLDTTHAFLNPPYQNDIYYANYQYDSGWKYKNYIIGNPFVNTLMYFDSESLTWKNYEKTKVFHLGIHRLNLSNYYQVNISKKININDDIKYKIVIGKTIKEKFDMNIFLVNNNKKNGVGFGISTTF